MQNIDLRGQRQRPETGYIELYASKEFEVIPVMPEASSELVPAVEKPSGLKSTTLAIGALGYGRSVWSPPARKFSKSACKDGATRPAEGNNGNKLL